MYLAPVIMTNVQHLQIIVCVSGETAENVYLVVYHIHCGAFTRLGEAARRLIYCIPVAMLDTPIPQLGHHSAQLINDFVAAFA